MQARLASDGCRTARPPAGGGAFAKARAAICTKAGRSSRVLWGCREGGAGGLRARHSPAARERRRARPAWRTTWARVPGRAASAVFGWKALAARMRPVPVRRVVRFGTGSVGRSLLRRALRLRRLRKGGARSRVLGCGSFRPMAASLAMGRRGARSCGEAARPRPFGRGSAAPPRAVRGGAGGG